jgi:hypothetical protein
VRLGALGLVVLLLAGGCAVRGRLPDGESRAAAAFFTAVEGAVPFPEKASFSGVATYGDDAYPFIAGVTSLAPSEETVGFFDPLGHALLTISNDGSALAVSSGPDAGLLSALDGRRLAAGPVSLGRILSGAPGYPVGKGEFLRGGDGGWRLEDGRQTLSTDPGRRWVSLAVYSLGGRTLTVSYPGRETAEKPRTVELEGFGAKIVLRRDEE